MDNKTITKRFFLIFPFILVIVVAIAGGYILGNFIVSKKFAGQTLNNSDIEQLRDDLTSINYQIKTPADFSGAIAFQIAEKVLRESTNYEVIGTGNIETSLGVSQSSKTIDRRNGDELYIAFTTFSSFVKESRQSFYTIGGDVNLQHGKPSDPSVDNVEWTDTYENYTWEEYYETFGKYANVNCSYIVSTKTIISDSGVSKDGDLYKCTLELDTKLGSSAYVKQIGANMGVNPASVIFNKIAFTFWLDENFKFAKQEKYESYTVPYLGINLTLNANVEVAYTIS